MKIKCETVGHNVYAINFVTIGISEKILAYRQWFYIRSYRGKYNNEFNLAVGIFKIIIEINDLVVLNSFLVYYETGSKIIL